MSSMTDAAAADGASPTTDTITYKSLASIDEINVVHDITISNFQKWRTNFDLLGPIEGTLDIPIPNSPEVR